MIRQSWLGSGWHVALLLVVWVLGRTRWQTVEASAVTIDQERAYLVQFAINTQSSQWLTKWNVTNPWVCTWPGISCNANRTHVTAIELPNNNMAGPIPADLWKLPDLTILNLEQNHITELGISNYSTSVVGGRPALTWLDLSGNNLQHLNGLEVLQNLQVLRVGSNQLATFPTQVLQLHDLQILSLPYSRPMQHNNATLLVGNWTQLTELQVSSNLMQGPLPTQLGLLTSLRSLQLTDNAFTGTLPTELNLLTNLESLSLRAAVDAANGEASASGTTPLEQLTGPLLSFANLTQLTQLHLSDHALTGSIPDDFLVHSERKQQNIMINLANNRLSGTLSMTSSALLSFRSVLLDVTGNQITSLPDEYCEHSLWMNGLVEAYGCAAILCPPGTFNQHGRQVDATQPCVPCQDTTLAAQTFMGNKVCASSAVVRDEVQILLEFYNAMDGPNWLQQQGWNQMQVLLDTHGSVDNVPAAALRALNLCGGGSTTTVPFFGIWCVDGRVQRITLPHNDLRGVLPATLFQLAHLAGLDLSHNTHVQVLDWSIMAAAPALTFVDLSHTSVNSFAGFGALVAANRWKRLELAGNPIDATLPAQLWEFRSLEVLRLDACGLLGTLPMEIGHLTGLTYLNLNQNDLSGFLPTTFGRLSNLRSLELSDNAFSGELPQEFEDLVSIVILKVNAARGGLGGPLLSLSRLSQLEDLELEDNLLTGTIPMNFLESSPKNVPVKAWLGANRIGGTIPTTLSAFSMLDIHLEDNQIIGLPEALCDRDDWMGSEVSHVDNRCDAILCPPGTWSSHGRASTDFDQTCKPCSANKFFGGVTCETGTIGASPEQDILDELFEATGGRYWTQEHTNWTKSDIPICFREGVRCAQTSLQNNSGVTELLLTQFGLRGTVPTSVFSLPSIRRLALAWNEIDVSLSAIGNATSLEILLLSGTQVQSLKGLENAAARLYEFHAAKTKLGGAFPSEVLQLRHIRSLHLNENALTGTIPSSLGNLHQLNELVLFENVLSGLIPSELAQMRQLLKLDLGKNQLVGGVPDSFERIRNLEVLDLSYQRSYEKLSGPMPSLANFTAIKQVKLAGNAFAGEIPADFLASARKNDTLMADLSSNKLIGSIPVSFDAFTKFNLDLSDNLITAIPHVLCDNNLWMGGMVGRLQSCDAILCRPGMAAPAGKADAENSCRPCEKQGEAPRYGSTACIADSVAAQRNVLSELYERLDGPSWDMHDGWMSDDDACMWYGISCDESGAVSAITLESNGLQNADPDFDSLYLLSRLASLRSLNLKGNEGLRLRDLVGLGRSSSVEELRLSATGLTSLRGVGRLAKLRLLHAQDNALTGMLPDELFGLSELTELFVSFNALTGTLSTNIFRLTALQRLYLASNGMIGNLPTELASLRNLREIVLENNSFSGTVPTVIATLPLLEQLLLQNQQGSGAGLSGILPDFSQAKRLRVVDLSDNSLTGTIPASFLRGAIDLSMNVEVVLSGNKLQGHVPAELERFDDLFIDVTNNAISHIPVALCSKSRWMNEGVGKYGCDAILCPRGYFNTAGRQSGEAVPCLPCSEPNDYLGQVNCGPILTERQILTILFDGSGGRFWNASLEWTTATPVCQWYGVECAAREAENGIVSLSLDRNGLAGSLPTQIWQLPSLTILSVEGNPQLTLSFQNIQYAQNLEVLRVSETMVDTLAGLSSAPSLRKLVASGAQLGGTFPSNILTMGDRLVELDLSQNHFVGTIPLGLSKMSALQTFNLSYNDFNGPLPAEVDTMERLRMLALDENLFSGVLSTIDFAKLGPLESLTISRRRKSGRKLTGRLPVFFESSHLHSLVLDHNSFTGFIPRKFATDGAYFVTLNLAGNLLTGAIPSSLPEIHADDVRLEGNMFVAIPDSFCVAMERSSEAVMMTGCFAALCPPGTVLPLEYVGQNGTVCPVCHPPQPSSLYYGSLDCDNKIDDRSILVDLYNSCDGPNWTRRDLWNSSAEHCEWDGVGCDTEGFVTTLNLRSARLQCDTVASSLYRLSRLQYLDLSENAVALSFSDVGFANGLLELHLDNTLTTTLDGISNCASLVHVSASLNRLGGTFPLELMDLWNLRVLDVSFALLIGQLPSTEEFGKLKYLRRLVLANNELTGELPSFEYNPVLSFIDLGSNRLSGVLPGTFLKFAPRSGSPIVIDLTNNLLTGAVPQELGRFDIATIELGGNRFSGVHPGLCGNSNWNSGYVNAAGCDGLLCAPTTAAIKGRAHQQVQCESCPQANANWYGQTDCPGQAAELDTSGTPRLVTFLIWTNPLWVSLALAAFSFE